MARDGLTIPVHLQTRDDRRRAERFAAEMPVSIDGRPGTTQDLSTSGLSFQSDRAYPLGAMVDVVIEYLLDGHQYPLRCQAEVVRSVPEGDGFRIGARLTPQSRLADVDVGDDGAGAGRPHLRPIG